FDRVVSIESRRHARQIRAQGAEAGWAGVDPRGVLRLLLRPQLARAPRLAGRVRGPAAIDERNAAFGQAEARCDPIEPLAHSLLAAIVLSSLRSPRESKMCPTRGSPCKRSAVTLRPFVAASTYGLSI